MIVEPAQFEILRRATLQRFVERLMAHFAELWPREAAALGERYRQFITRAVEKAQGYGLNNERAIARYVNLCFVWGADFETRPQHQWALEILTDENRSAPLKAHQLAWRTREELKRLRAARQPAMA
jgi:hypothetical protein